jgi:hypothetical protein
MVATMASKHAAGLRANPESSSGPAPMAVVISVTTVVVSEWRRPR